MTERRTLVTAFSPPDGLVGTVALICGLNADATTIDLMLSEFTGENEQQRRLRGVATAVLAVDRRSSRRELRTVAGLCVAEPVLASWQDGSMLHAKVALLGFAVDPYKQIEKVRLVVSTGNWTGASLSEQIDMLWVADLDMMAGRDDASRADAAAAAGFFQDLLFGDRNLFQMLPPMTGRDGLLALCLTEKVGRSRFIHSIDKPLLNQIGKRFVPSASKWNWVYAGSGFFEQAGDTDPIVLERIYQQLSRQVTGDAKRWVVVNPEQPGVFATRTCPGWTVCEPNEDDGRTFMHAKFIAAGRQVKEKHYDVTVYLGSGNLSKAGLLTSFGSSRQSRIEAGVVFRAGTYTDNVLWRILPDSTEMDKKRLKTLVSGPEEPKTPTIQPPPVLYAQLFEAAQGSRLRLQKTVPEIASQIRVQGTILDLPVGVAEVDAPKFQDAYLEVRASETDTWEAIPVIGSDGGFARVRTPPGTVEDLLEALLAFPFLPEPDVDDEGFDNATFAMPQSHDRRRKGSSYPARDAMRIVDEVARLAADAGAKSADHMSAVSRALRHRLIEGLCDDDKAALAELGINFTSPLKEMPGMPNSDEWSALIDQVAEDWGLTCRASLSFSTFRREKP